MKYSSNTGLFNRKCLSHFFVIEFLFFFLLIFWLSANNTFSQTSVKISLPLDRTVFQQSTANNATFQLAGQINYYYPSSMGSTLEYQIESLSRTGEVIATTQSWTGTGINYATSSGFFNKTLTLSTGWYRISVRYNTNYSGSIKSNAIKVGVGEVLFAAGQSNAQGVEMGGSNKGGIPDLKGNYDCINAVNQNCWCKQTYDFPIFKQMEYSAEDKVSRIAPNGNQTLWCYQALGKQIVDKNTNVVTPVVFFNAGSGGTGIDNWSTSAGNPNGTTINPLGGYQNCQSNFADWNSEGPQGHPYRGLKTGLNYYGGMLGTRGVIWHQGESDTKENTSEVSYRDKFRAVIQQTRNDFNSNLGWAISRVSRLQYNENIITSDAVKRGQAYINSSASSLSNITWGGYYSDEIADRLPDNTHFNASGLLKLAELYATGNFAGNTAGGNQGGAILSLTPVEFNNRPSLAVNVTRPNTGEITMTVSGSHNGYKWVKNEGKISEAIYFTQGITVNNDGTDKWRCYVSDNKGNVAITQEVALPVREAIVVGTECPSGTFRPSSDKITCDEISGWVFRDNANGPYGVVDVYVDGYKKNTITANLSKYYYGEGGSRGFASNEGYIYNVPANASWRDGVNHTVSVRQCNYNVDFASASLNCPTNSGGPSCDNGASPFSMTSVNYNSSSRCVEYQFNANNLSNANWSIKQGNTTLYSGSLPQPITSNTGTVNCGVTLASGTYDFVLTGVSCNGTTTRAFTVSGGGCSSPAPGLSANPTSISSGQSSTLSASGCSGTITWNDGTTGPTKTVSSPGTYTATCTNSGCSTSSPASVTVGNSGNPSCDNGASPFSMTSVNYNSSSRCVEYQFNANNLSNANWSIKQGNTTLYSGSLPQPITSNAGTVNCGVTLASGTYDFVLTGVSCNGTTTRAFTVSGGGCSSPAPGLSANPTSISSGQSSTLSASGCSGTITWNDGTTGSTKTVSSPGTYTATCTNSGCSTSSPASATVSSSGNPSCDNGASPFSMTSVNYNSSSRCVEYQFNANNLSNANWSIKQGNTTLYSGSLPQPITSNTGTVNCGVTLASGTYDFVLTGVSCNGTTTRAFTVSGGGCSSPTPGLSANPTSISSEQSSTLSASGCSGTITWNDGTTGSTKTVSSPGTYTATCTNSGCSTSSPASVTVGSSGGEGCPTYTEGQQFLHDNSTNENFYAHFSSNGVLYATIDGLGLYPPVSRQRLINAGLSANTANCFADGNTGSRLASIESVEIEDVFKAAPNPSSGRMTLLFTLKNDEVIWFNLYDVYGKSIQIVSFDGKKGQNQMEVDLSNYPSLIYYIHLQSAQKNETIKVLKRAE